MSEDYRTVILHENADGTEQVRLVVSSFRDRDYLSIRKYYNTIDGEWLPSREGITLPYSLMTSLVLFNALAEMLSSAEIQPYLELLSNEQAGNTGSSEESQ